MTERWQRWIDGRIEVGDNRLVHVGPLASTGRWLFEVVADDMAEYQVHPDKLARVIEDMRRNERAGIVYPCRGHEPTGPTKELPWYRR